jgi:hypothetical protein
VLDNVAQVAYSPATLYIGGYRVRIFGFSRSSAILLAIVAISAAGLVACSGDDDDDTQPTSPAATATEEAASPPADLATAPPTGASSATPTLAPGVLIDGYIGTATMEEDGTLSLALRAARPDGTAVTGFFEYPPDHANYQEILDHVGPIEPGETVDVLPFD